MIWEFETSTAAQTQQIADRLAALLAPGDLIILSGELGAGKTTFTQGLGRSLGVREGIISPTFVLVRIHPNLPDGPRPGGPDLVHVDAYRLGTPAEIDDIDLERTLDTSVTVVEWGRERVEHLSDNRLEIELVRATGADSAQVEADFDFEEKDDDEPRLLRLTPVGERWENVDFSSLADTSSQQGTSTTDQGARS